MDNSYGMYAVFIEAVKGEQRTQWFLFPPANSAYGTSRKPDGSQRFIKRRIERKGHRAKWKTTQRAETPALEEKLKLELDQYESTEWVLRQPVVIALEQDDYLKVWDNEAEVTTPYKALRHVEAVTKKRGYRLVD